MHDETYRRHYILNHFMPEESERAGHPVFWDARHGGIIVYTIEDVARRLEMTVEEVGLYLFEGLAKKPLAKVGRYSTM